MVFLNTESESFGSSFLITGCLLFYMVLVLLFSAKKSAYFMVVIHSIHVLSESYCHSSVLFVVELFDIHEHVLT